MLTVDVEAGEEAAGVMSGTPPVLDQIAANVFEAARAAAKGNILTDAPVSGGRETVAGRAAYLYRGALTNRHGVRMEVELWIIAIDGTHVGLIVVAGGGGAASTQQLRQVARAARLSSAHD